MSSVVVVTSDPAITITQDNTAVTTVVPVSASPPTQIGFGQTMSLPTQTDFNTVTAAGFYNTSDALTANAPVNSLLWYLRVEVDGATTGYLRQIATVIDGSASYVRALNNGTWTAWQQVVWLDNSGRLPAVDASQLINIPTVIPRGYLAGLTLSTAGGSSSFSIAAGMAADSTSAALMALSSAFTKTTATWAAGTGNGALDTGTIANSTWYHVHLIKNPSGAGTVDVLFSLSATTPTLPSGFTLFRRIGSMKTDGSAHWTAFSQLGDEFLWLVAANDANAATVPTSAALITLSVPTGVQVLINATIFVNQSSSGTAFYLFTSPDITDTVPSGTDFDILTSTTNAAAFMAPVRTNTSAQIRWRTAGGTSGTAFITTRGWYDRRGKDA